MEWNGSWFGLVIAALIGGLIVGFLICRKLTAREMKKNPPINENMIRAMFMQMGRKPSEADIKKVIKSMNNNK